MTTDSELDVSPGTVRAWAQENGYLVASMGMVPRDVVNAYRLAHGEVLDARAKIARPTVTPADAAAPAAAALPGPVTFREPGPVPPVPMPTVEVPGPVSDGATVAELREQLDALGAGYSAAVQKENAAHAAVERLRAELDEATTARSVVEVDLARARAELARLREVADLPCPGTHCGQEATCPAAAPALPEPVADLMDAWHKLFAKASEVETEAGHTLAEHTAPALVRETADRVHDLIRLLDGDVSR